MVIAASLSSRFLSCIPILAFLDGLKPIDQINPFLPKFLLLIVLVTALEKSLGYTVRTVLLAAHERFHLQHIS